MSVAVSTSSVFDVARIRRDFPILATNAHGKPLVYLDNAATTQKPHAVLDALRRYYEADNANIHRGVYELSQRATEAYEAARVRVQKFLNARHSHEIIFTRGTTESINLVAQTFGRSQLKNGDEILISAMEHHSNIVPWQMLCEQTDARLRIIPINDQGELQLDAFHRLLGERTRLVSIVHVSNSLGSLNPVREIIAAAHARAVPVMVDGAQWVAHGKTDVQALDADFYAFSGHKIYGPTGIGVLYGKSTLLDAMPPWQGGGDMIASVTFEKTTYAGLPNKLEAGTPHISGAIGLAAALDYLDDVGLASIAAHEANLLAYATTRLVEVPGLRIIGTSPRKGAVISFILESPPMSSMDVGVKLDLAGVAVRTGHHCCQPVMDRFHIPSTARVSFAMYNTREEVDVLVDALQAIVAAPPAPPARGVEPPPASPAAIAYPQASARSPEDAAAEIAEEFTFLDTREAKNEYLLDLGKQLPPLFDLLKQVTPRVPGCMSEVYVVGRRCLNDPRRLEFVADANAEIVRGLIAVVQRLFSGQQAEAILKFDVEGFFRRIQLDQFITSQRRNGLAGMVQRIRQLATHMQSEAGNREGAGSGASWSAVHAASKGR